MVSISYHFRNIKKAPNGGHHRRATPTQPAYIDETGGSESECMPLLGGANSATPHLSDGIAPARLSASGRAKPDGFSVAEPPSLVFKNGGFSEATKKHLEMSERNPTAAITGLRSGHQLTFHCCCPLKQIRVHGMVGCLSGKVYQTP
ncbi:MAG: hypothetical protein K1Y36_27995, partial [Blastocatellia bacterium]|nr:hypothetical protein [Blastocatellia bacterium]